MPLDRQQIPEPTDIIKTFLAMMVNNIIHTLKYACIPFYFQSGQFLPDNEVLRRTMKVQKSALSKAEVAMYGPMVIDTCPEYIKTYRLVQKTAEEMKRKSIFACLIFFYFYVSRTSPSFIRCIGIYVFCRATCSHV